MSGKPASVAATRAGAPRVLVYVADPRQLEPGAAADQPPPPPPQPAPDALYLQDNASQHLAFPRNTVYRSQIEHNDQRNLPNTIFYKSYNDNDNKLSALGSSDNGLVQRTDFFPVSQQYIKEATVKIDESKVCESTIKRDVNQFRAEFGGVEGFRIATETADTSTYQTRCVGPISDNIMPPVQSVALRQGPIQFESNTVQSEGTNCSDRELSVGKNYVNYQFLEQSVSHQSIVNQSISILNQQVGVSRGVTSEGESGGGPQLVRTADGVVLAVLPSSVLPQSSDTPELVPRTHSDNPQTISVPLGWRRIVSGTSVLYISPSGTALSTLPQLRDYLQTAGTCKCGLPCPLRPETTFSFDPKVVSKPYQPASGAELTKLCNHKRKLLASLQARAHSPATPPPPPLLEHKKGTEVGTLKKKMKKRPGFPPNMSVSQLMVQRERPLNDFKVQDNDPNRTLSPGIRSNQNCMATFSPGPQAANDADVKQDTPVQRGSHYLTVSSGWITQHDAPAGLGTPVIGTNGQLIGVNTGYNKQTNYKNSTTFHSQNVPDQEHKEDRRDTPAQQSVQSLKRNVKEEESQIFCGLNQPLTPEVMQKINEQQQIFIQQNQKQIEMAMKGFRSQLAENINKPIAQSQYVPQGQLVIQNGAVVKTNPAKTPPWQVKRNDSNANPMTSPSPKLQNLDFDDSTSHSVSEDSSGSYNSFSNGEQTMNQAMCSRVPPLPQHYNMIGQQWPTTDCNKKKTKTGNAKGGRKKASPIENKVVSFNTHGVRMIQEQKVNNCEEAPNNTLPSFMDDPSGYLAQQTVLLNNTISKQVGMNAPFDGNRFENTNNSFGQQCLRDRSCKSVPKTCDISNFRINTVPNPSPSPSNTPDSSVLSDKSSEQCCKACNVSRGNSEFADNQMRLKYMRSNMYKMEQDGSATSSPRHGFEDNPVTSSTFDRSPPGPVQAGPVSTTDLPDAPPPDRTPGPPYSPYPAADRLTGTQVMHFISNHNVNKNLMEVDNISMVGVKPALRSPAEAFLSEQRRRLDNMPGYCPPPHLGGGPAHSLVQACYVQSFASTVAGGCSVTRDTVTSVLAGRARTCTTSVNAASFVRPPPPPGPDPAAGCAIPNNQPDPFIDSVNLPTSYPLHIAGTTAQNMISKSPLEIAQNVIGGAPSKPDGGGAHTMTPNRRACTSNSGQILISSTGQIIVSGNQMPPPPPKTSTSQVVSGVVNQSTVVVNALPTPFVLQPPVVAVDGQVLPQLVAGVVGHSPPDSARHVDVKHGQGIVQGVAMLSPETLKKRSKKKKGTSVTNVLQIAAPQQPPSNIVVHSSPQHSASPQFSPRGFQLSPNNISPTPVLQALTIVPGKSGTPAHIVMNGQPGAGGFGSQPLLANASPSQQINLLQPVNLINNASGVVPNFPAFQQFIVPNLGGVVMTADGGAIVQDGSGGMPVQLQLQTVNGQNVLTPVQGQGVFAGANGGVVIRAQNQQGKIVQSQHSPGAQFLSPTGQVVVNGPNFNGQLSPLLANLSPTSVTFNTSPHQVRSGSVQTQEFIQTNQMGQTLMVPLSPKRASLATAANRGNSTFVQQNTTIVQQQTTLVSNSAGAPPELAAGSRLALDPELLLGKQPPPDERPDNDGFAKFAADFGGMSAHVRHSVSTQTLVGARAGAGPASSPPDTTTHSPLGALEASRSPRRARSRSGQAHYADTTTDSPPPPDNSSSAMVQCVSSSEPDVAESRELGWPAPRSDFNADHDTQNLMSTLPLMRQNGAPSSAETTEMHYNRSMSSSAMSNPHMLQVSSDCFDRSHGYKRKNDFGDGSSYRTDKIMRTNNGMVHGMPKDVDFESLGNDQNKSQPRHFSSSSGSDTSTKVFDRRNLGSGDDAKSGEECRGGAAVESFEVGDLVWGPVRGFASWPGCVAAAAGGGRLRVRWFGGGKPPPPPAALPPRALLSLSDGLEAHHAARTKHRKSRKLNTHLENAIQEAMAELDKKSERTKRDQEQGTSEEAADSTPIIDTPKRSKKQDKARKDGNHKKSKITLSSTKVSDSSRLRSLR